ncbi:MAG TPA: hypothetical protein DCP90_03970 [Clostridiales bacterium]|nr:MAG: hypothetical protein A2Y22_07200 [Clostridiales bacterium GWD2_32_59]HAN09752.1 hypothetical protein [Clostridiales bacterium]
MEFLEDLFGDLVEGKKKHKNKHGDKSENQYGKHDDDDFHDNRNMDKRKYDVREEQGSKVCTNCSAKIVHDAKFCGRCGTKVNEARHCTDCGTKMQADASFCQNCGKKN